MEMATGVHTLWCGLLIFPQSSSVFMENNPSMSGCGLLFPEDIKTWIVFLNKKMWIVAPHRHQKGGLFLLFKNVVCWFPKTQKRWIDSLIQKSFCAQSSLLSKTCFEYPKIWWIFTSETPRMLPQNLVGASSKWCSSPTKNLLNFLSKNPRTPNQNSTCVDLLS